MYETKAINTRFDIPRKRFTKKKEEGKSKNDN